MIKDLDRRLWSTTARGLSAIIGGLQRRGMPSTSVRFLQQMLGRSGIYPAREFAEHCEAEPPDVFFTYHSAEHLFDIPEAVWKALDFAAQQLRRRRPELQSVDLDPFVGDGIRLWLDFVFIDQSARDLRSELDAMPRLLEQARAHFVLGDVPLTRAWCTYEIALFNRHCASGDTSAFRSFVAPTGRLYRGWDQVEVSEAGDKWFLQERIETAFPGGFRGFDHVMQRANAAAVSGTERHPQDPAVLEALAEAVEVWYDRRRGGTAIAGRVTR